MSVSEPHRPGFSASISNPGVISPLHRPAPATSAAACFTTEETIVLRSLAAGNSTKQVGRDLRLPNWSLLRILSDLRRKTATADNVALAVWALRQMQSSDQRRPSR
jgi:DNA-binding NarL/FixJ family response regulator